MKKFPILAVSNPMAKGEITYIEHASSSYAPRTYENAKCADITIAFAVVFETQGEKMTKKAAKGAGKHYLPVALNDLEVSFERVLAIRNRVKSYGLSEARLNIAGNGIYTLAKHRITQEQIDKFVFDLLTVVFTDVKIVSVRSGGQTGADEAGLKFGIRKGIKTICCFPYGWLFRGANGVDMRDEAAFKARFK